MQATSLRPQTVASGASVLHGDNLTVMVDVLDFFLCRNSKELI